MSLGTPYENSSSAASPSRISSFFGRINYGYNDKYLATVTLRADGSSKFAKGNRWGFFPAGALAWRISNEDFLKDNQVVSNLKLRLSYGSSGNDRIDADLYQKLYGVTVPVLPDGEKSATITITSITLNMCTILM